MAHSQIGYRQPRHRAAFTLVEVLVVIAIVAIVSSMLFPVFTKARESAKSTACYSNLKQLGYGILLYTNDYDDLLPPYTNCEYLLNLLESAPGPLPTSSEQPWLLKETLSGYTGAADDSWYCPLDPVARADVFRYGSRHGHSSYGFVGLWQPALFEVPARVEAYPLDRLDLELALIGDVFEYDNGISFFGFSPSSNHGSNHPTGSANALHKDLSLYRHNRRP